uniref:DH domain-containing protein n=1 Tax=Zonotrichia albicollis TaxID=44394 RepID=A0A8D2LY29_ZONAL
EQLGALCWLGLNLSAFSCYSLGHPCNSSFPASIPDLLASLGEATKPDGTVEQIGPILVKWLPRLHAYKGYCSNQLAAKALLDQKKQDRRVQDFLQRCLESPFSRKLDLWSFLDIPRSRLVKYPLLLKEILRHTPKEHPDIHILQEAISIIQGVLSDINVKKGESECQYYIDKLEYLDEKQKDPRIEGSKALLCHGELKNKNGHKLYVFLFQEMLVLTRPVTRNERQAFQVYRQPIPVQELLLEDLQDGDVKMGGSFRGAFGNSDKGTELWERRGLGWTETRDLCSQGWDLGFIAQGPAGIWGSLHRALLGFGVHCKGPCWNLGFIAKGPDWIWGSLHRAWEQSPAGIWGPLHSTGPDCRALLGFGVHCTGPCWDLGFIAQGLGAGCFLGF